MTNKIVKRKKMIQLIAQACTKMLILDLLFCEIIYVLLWQSLNGYNSQDIEEYLSQGCGFQSGWIY